MAKEFPFAFTVLMDIGPAVSMVIGDTIQVTSDGGLRVFLGKRLVGAVKPLKWSGCVLRPMLRSESATKVDAVDPSAADPGKPTTRDSKS